MITTHNFIFLATLILSLLNSANANCNLNSACGDIRNISFPFHLKSHCGHPKHELICENNVTFLYLNSIKYHVKDINYTSITIRVVDASINNDTTCPFPNTSSAPSDFTRPSSPYYYSHLTQDFSVNLFSCPNPLSNATLFTDITQDCATNLSYSTFRYVKVGRVKASEVPHMCRLDQIVLTSWQEFIDVKNVSLSQIHQSLLYGFELDFCYRNCSEKPTKLELLRYRLSSEPYDYLLIPLAIIVFIIAGVSFPVTIIVAITGLLIISFTSFWEDLQYNHYYQTLLQETYHYFAFIAFVATCVAITVCLTAALNPLLIITIGAGVGLALYFIITLNWGVYMVNELMYITLPAIITGIIICAPKIIICPLVVCFLIYKFQRRRLSSFEEVESFLQSENKLAPIRYSYSDIKKMTKNFKDKLGQGGYGSVHKGKLRSGHLVAVKLLGKSRASGQDFMNEIATIGRIHHVNIVQLVGYCAERSKRALIFDFMSNGSLDKYVFNREKTSSLDWDMKFKIAVQVAQGIEYLHHGCDIQILHFDIKPHNILLDDKFVPKISDFGLAKLCCTNKEVVTLTTARGTIGYVAPELINRCFGAVSYKADVYSFGMLLMEMVSLNKDLTRNNDESSKYFPNWIYDHLNQGRQIHLGNVDENDDGKTGLKMTIVALWCIQMCPNNRPSMNKVLEMLEGDGEHLQIPDYPVYMAGNEEGNWATDSNDASISLLHDNSDSTIIEITSSS